MSAETSGPHALFRANLSSEVFHELRGLVLKSFGLRNILQDALQPVQSEIQWAFVFGSLVSGEDHDSSDVDLIVVTDTLAYAEVSEALRPAVALLQRTASPLVYTKDQFTERVKRDGGFVRRVLGRPTLWLIGSESELVVPEEPQGDPGPQPS